jgi:hypothetical protein
LDSLRLRFDSWLVQALKVEHPTSDILLQIKLEGATSLARKKMFAILSNSGYVKAHGLISYIFGRSRLYSPANRYSGKTPCFNSWQCSSTFNIHQRPTKNFGGDSRQVGGCRPCSLGPTKSGRESGRENRGQKKGRTHPCGAEETFPTDESPMGGKKKSRWGQVSSKGTLLLYVRGIIEPF